MKMSAKRPMLLVLAALVTLGFACARLPAASSSFVPDAPARFKVRLWARVPHARSLALSPDGSVLFVGTRQSQVYKVTVKRNEAEKVELFQDGIKGSNGVCFVGDDLFLAERQKVLRFPASEGFPPGAKGKLVLDGFPDKVPHGWRYLKQGPDGRLMLAIGAPCNCCLSPDDERLGSICSFRPDGTDFRVDAHGVRNSVGFDWEPATGDFYFTDNGRDHLGDDIPPCELNLLPKGSSGRHYGFPYFWGANNKDPEFGDKAPPGQYQKPVVDFQAHVAPLGCHFPRHERWKGLLDGKLLVAQHGSWNRSSKVGYQVVAIDLHAATPVVEPFLTGFLSEPISGRPVDITELRDGTLLVSDDHGGKIWAVTPDL
jgi:glucose/arabinose dehydrogenase